MNVLIFILVGAVVSIASVFIFFKVIPFFSSDDSKKLSERDEQNKKNVVFISRIIHGNYTPIPEAAQTVCINAFTKWQVTENNIFDKATKAQQMEIIRNLESWGTAGYKGLYSTTVPGPDYDVVLPNCFTEAFTSTYDADDFYRNKLISEFMILKVVDPLKSEDYYFHEKGHFVNNAMTKGIIMVDLYRKKSSI